ncbi:hypothetical protein WG907_01010 [Sphingobium sp. AN558]|uniref:hypothetical protein n=1 Tax=Sphingobium sp. AN558 TaxID=3133442 RepID=UPI0030BF9859
MPAVYAIAPPMSPLRAVHLAFSGHAALAGSMGFRHSILLMLPLVLASPARAQDDSAAPIFNLPRAGANPPADTRQQGPELDVFRGPAAQPVTPPVADPVAPVIAPVPAPPVAATPAPATQPRVPRRPTATPAAPPKEEPAAAPRPQIEPAPPPTQTERTGASSVAPPVIAPAPPPVTRAAPSAALPWEWIAAAGALLALIAAALIRRRRAEPEALAEESPPPMPVVPPSPAFVPPLVTPAEPDGARARLDFSLEVDAARYSLMGATISYRLAVHNLGEQPAEEILIRALLTNAGTTEQATLDAFLDQSLGSPAHSIVALAPGEGQWLSGELRLSPDEIAPLHVGERALLVPLALFDLHYHWSDGEGRIARSFLVGQAPAQAEDRLAPLRMDTGPRQFRNPAARAVGDLVSR